ncbi:MAG: ion channel [Alphaproteobacteria bacterium]
MIEAMATCLVLVLLTVLVHYEVLRLTSGLLPHLRVRPRARMVIVILATFGAHVIEVILYAVAYYVFVEVLGLGGFAGAAANETPGFLYFSVVTYTSLGLGDVYPLGGMRLIAGVEALNGLLLIGWSASFTYLTMEKFWPLHAYPRRQTRDD